MHPHPPAPPPALLPDPAARPQPSKRVLNVGCGPRGISVLGPAFPPEEWEEIRLDIDPAVGPDILASMTDMPEVPDASFEAVWSSHNLEHLQAHEVPKALREFLRVLRPGGVLMLAVPDLQAVAAHVAEGRLDTMLYQSDAGAVSALDIIYGFGPALAAGNHFMAHRTGFTAGMIGHALQSAGFEPIALSRVQEAFELRVRAFRPPASAEVLASLGLGPLPR